MGEDERIREEIEETYGRVLVKRVGVVDVLEHVTANAREGVDRGNRDELLRDGRKPRGFAAIRLEAGGGGGGGDVRRKRRTRKRQDGRQDKSGGITGAGAIAVGF